MWVTTRTQETLAASRGEKEQKCHKVSAFNRRSDEPGPHEVLVPPPLSARPLASPRLPVSPLLLRRRVLRSADKHNEVITVSQIHRRLVSSRRAGFILNDAAPQREAACMITGPPAL